MVQQRLALSCWLAILLIGASAAAQPPNPDRRITPLRGGLYTATEGTRTTIFLVTTGGILLVDPLNVDFAQWLKEEFDARFPGQPVKYVVYSGLDFDRAGGAGHFDQTAEIVANAGLDQRLARSRSLPPPRFAALDRDGNGILVQSELATIDVTPNVQRLDFNSDGQFTANELWSSVLAAEATYGSRRTITLGDARVDLIFPGPALGNDVTVVHFPAERVAFAARMPSLTTPFASSSRPSEMATWARTIGTLDADTLLSGTGQTLTRSQISDFTIYVSTLVTGVIVGYENGRSLQQLQQGTVIGRFTGTPFAATRESDIAYVYRRTRMQMVDAEGSVLVNHVPTDSATCQTAISCRVTSENGFGGAASIGLSVRRWRFAGEVNVGHRINITATGTTWFESRNRRDTLISGLVGYRTSPSATLNLSLLAGPTVARTTVEGASRGGFISNPPLLPYAFGQAALGVTVGADLMAPIGSRVRVTVPVRFTALNQESGGYRTKINLRAGVGLSVSIWRTRY